MFKSWTGRSSTSTNNLAPEKQRLREQLGDVLNALFGAHLDYVRWAILSQHQGVRKFEPASSLAGYLGWNHSAATITDHDHSAVDQHPSSSRLRMSPTAEIKDPTVRRRPPNRFAAFYRATVGKKVVVAVSGLVLLVFVVGHLVGNLQIFLGAEALNDYAALLRRTPALLWPARVGLLAALVLHVIASAQLVMANRRARPAPYAVKRDIETTYAARTMAISGPLVLLYVIYHLAMLTFLVTGPGYSHTDVYRNVVQAFQSPTISAVYIAALLLLGLHLYHGLWSMLHTLGVSSPHYRWLRRGLAPVVAVVITAGYLSIPLAVLTGFVK